MKKNTLRSVSALALVSWALVAITSCTDDLDRLPKYDLNSETVYKDAAGYKAVLAKVYGGFALTGSQGPAGENTGDVKGIDEGTSDYIRQYWSAQELTTDEAVVQWGDPGIQDWHLMNWTSTGVLIQGLYSRILYEVTLCNSFLAESTDDKLSGRGISETDAATIRAYRAEVRFLRALAYYHALDLYGNVPFATEADEIGGTTPPKQTTRPELFAFLEKELQAIDADLPAPRQNEYARADKAAAWMLLAKLYLNAEVYTKTARYADCATYAKKVIDAGYSLTPQYRNLFLTDNNTSREIIFPIAYDGRRTQGFGGTTFLVHGPVANTSDANWDPASYGIGGGWGGLRTTSAFYRQFPDTAADTRARFVTGGQTLEIASLTDFYQGYVPIKFKNVSSTGVAGSDPTFVDTDYPMFRLADAYLMYAEAAVRGGGDRALALEYVNRVRTRAFKNTAAGNITASDLTLDFLLSERSRELFWEATRRTDLIRYNRFTTGDYLWPWKGGAAAGTSVQPERALFPLPVTDLSVNPNLAQNPGY